MPLLSGLCLSGLLLSGLCLSGLWQLACGVDPEPIPIDRGPEPDSAAPDSTESSPDGAETRPARILTPPLGPKPSVAANPHLVASVREYLRDGGRRVPCGPYELWTDVRDSTLLVHLDALAGRLDAEYEGRLGLRPEGPSRETVVLFAGLRDFQRWEAAGAGSRGYAGHAAASEGIAVLHADRPIDDVLATTVHELAHLVHRRALGGPLPRWLSEGLADALGDSATSRGFLPLQGTLGVEGETRRLRSGLRAGHLKSLAQLVDKGAGTFDRPAPGAAAYDYEHSALFVRFLLTEPDLAPRFRSYLAALATGGRWSQDAFWQRLESDPGELDSRFRGWLQHLRL